MILNFSVENFQSIREKITLSFEPIKSEELSKYYVRSINNIDALKMALIFGPNASGKTTIMKALVFLITVVTTALDDKSQEFNLKQFALNTNKNTLFSIEFISDKRYLYELELNKKFVVNECLYCYDPKKSLIFERTTDSEKELSIIKFGAKTKISKQDRNALNASTLWNNTVLASSLKVNAQLDVLKSVTKWFQESFVILPPLIPLATNRTTMEIADIVNSVHNVSSDIFNEKIPKSILIELLKEADFGIDNIDISVVDMSKIKEALGKTFESLESLFERLLESLPENVQSEIKKNNFDIRNIMAFDTKFHHSYGKEGFSLSVIDEESSGTKRYYSLIGALLKAFYDASSPKIILIDELERSLHTDLVEHFILTFLKIFREHNTQLIATTHNRELLMDKDLLRKDIIWFTDKKPDGSTDLFSLSDFKTPEIRKVNSFYNFYKAGRLGAVPKLIDPREGLLEIK